MATKVTWKGDMSFEGETESNHRILMDLAEKSGGQDKGPRPIELVLVSLAGCTAVDVVSILKKMRQQLEGLEVNIESERVDQHPRIYKKIEIEFNLKGKNLKEESVKRAIDLSFNKYCSVKAMLGETTDISYNYNIVDV